MKYKIIKYLFFLICFTSYIKLYSQITINNSKTAEQLVNNVFLGSGVTASNITIKGINISNKYQYGDFIATGNTATKLGFKNGIVLTSGNTKDIPNTPCSALGNGGYYSSTSGEYRNDVDAKILSSGLSVLNICVLEFDFIPTSDSVKFRYAFGSAEYPSYNCNTFNDVFGFLLSGPGIAGGKGFSNNAVNLALLPGSNTYVTINNVNDGTSAGNECTLSPADRQKNFNGTVPSIAFCGFTNPLTAKAKVTPCQTYHIKLIIADVSDGAMDSGVFLEGESFSSPGVSASSQITDASGNPLINNYITENCSKAVLTFKANPIPTSDYTINYTLGGNADNNIDYTIPSSVKILAGQSSTQLTITPSKDNLDELDETITIQLNGQTTCTGTTPTQTPITITIKDELKITSTKTDPTCTGNNFNTDGKITITASGGASPYTYSIDNGSTYPHLISPITTLGNGTYNIKVKDKDGCIASDLTTITMNKSCGSTCTTPTISVQPQAQNICANTNTSFSISATGGSGYQWQVDAGTGSGYVNISDNSIYTGVTTATLNLTSVPANYNNYKYQCIVKESIGTCPNTSVNVNLTVKNIPTLIASPTNPLTCSGNGTIALTLTNVPDGNYEISYTSSKFSNVVVSSNTATITNVPVGNYNNLQITANGCTSAIGINTTITAPGSPTLSANPTNPSTCTGNGSIALTLSNVPNGTYEVNYTGGKFTNIVVSSNTATISNVPAGNYNNLQITANGCTSAIGINTTITAPGSPTLSANPTNPSTCTGNGSIALTLTNVSDGTYDVNYTGGKFTNIVVTSNTATISNVPVGDYNNLQITSNGCTSIIGINKSILAPTKPVLKITNPNAVCAPSTIDLTSNSIINGSTGVLVGGISYWTDANATNTLSNPNSISVTGIYYIKAVNGICSDIKPVDIKINNCSCPVALTITNPPAVCSPLGVDLTSPTITAGSTGIGSFTYWEDASATSTPLTNFSNVTVSKTYYIRMSGGACTDVKPVIVTINQSPELKITDPSAVCTPNTINITGSSVTFGSTGGGVLSYWEDSQASISLSNPSSISASKIYYIKATTTSGCSDIKPVNVSIGIKPTLTITNPISVCSPNTIDLTLSTVTAGSTNVNSLTYWQDVLASQILTNAGNISSSNTYYIKAENGNCSEIKPVIVTIKQSPSLVLNNPNEICEPNTVNLLAPSITNGSSNIGTLFYYSDAALLSTITNPSAYNVPGISTVYLKTTNSNSCSDTKALTVKINPKDIINISNPSSLCSNSPLETLIATPIGGTWTGSGIKANGELQPYLAKIGINDYTYTSNGICPNSKTIQITINAKPNLIISKKDTVCEGEEVLLQDISPYTNLTKCTWFFGDKNSSNTLKETKHKYFSSGTYDVTLIGTDAIGCSDTITEKEFIHVLKRPKSNFLFTPTNPTIFNNTIQTTNLSSNATNYQWEFGDEAKSLLTNPSHKYGNTPGIYFITLNAYNKVTSCNHDTTIQIEIFDEIYCYVPNSFTPNGDELNNEFKPLLSGSVAEENYSLYIFNRWGQLLFESHNKNVGWNGSYGNKISAPGTYIWKIEFTDTINKVKHMKTGHINLLN